MLFNTQINIIICVYFVYFNVPNSYYDQFYEEPLFHDMTIEKAHLILFSWIADFNEVYTLLKKNITE